jgi:hypothetical protein
MQVIEHFSCLTGTQVGTLLFTKLSNGDMQRDLKWTERKRQNTVVAWKKLIIRLLQYFASFPAKTRIQYYMSVGRATKVL